MRYLFIDPASNSTGWALFEVKDGKPKFVDSGTIVSTGTSDFAKQLSLFVAYLKLARRLKPTEIHIEQMPYGVHYKVVWSVGVIGTALFKATSGALVEQDISPTAWQAAVGWKKEKGRMTAVGEELGFYQNLVDSNDELAAIGMGLYFFEKKWVRVA